MSQQPRDAIGRFAATNTSANPKAEAVKRVARGRAGTKQSKAKQSEAREQRIAAAMSGQVEDRLKRFSETDRKYALLGGFAKSYRQIEQESGKQAADAALHSHLTRLTRRGAEESVDREDAHTERKQLLESGTKKQKAERAAIDRLHPEAKGLTLDRFKERYPDSAKDLLARHAKELTLDRVLNHDALLDRGRALMSATTEALDKTQDPVERIAIMDNLRVGMLQSGLPEREALKRVAQIKYDVPEHPDERSAREKFTVQKGATEFFQLSGGAGKQTLDRFTKTRDRAYASSRTREINIGSNVLKGTVFHEMGHHVEFEEPRIVKAAAEFRDRRATGDAKPLNQIEKYSNYDDDEVAKPDKFIRPYVGKVYRDGLTEVVSMGVQYFAYPGTMLELYEKDPDHFHFTLGILKRDV